MSGMKQSMDMSRVADSAASQNGGWMILPVVAVLGGAWAFAKPLGNGNLISLVKTLVVVLAGWTPLWRVLTTTTWSEPLAAWRTWKREAPLPHWPYLQPETPGSAIHRMLRQARSWWHDVGRAALAVPLRSAALAMIVSVLASLILGRSALMLTLMLIAWTEMAVLWHEGRGHAGSGWAAGALVGLPWGLGASLGVSEATLPALSSLALMLLMALYANPSPVAAFGPIVAAAFLIWQGQFVAAGILCLLALPGLMLMLHRPPVQTYRRVVTPWLVAMIVLVAWVL